MSENPIRLVVTQPRPSMLTRIVATAAAYRPGPAVASCATHSLHFVLEGPHTLQQQQEVCKRWLGIKDILKEQREGKSRTSSLAARSASICRISPRSNANFCSAAGSGAACWACSCCCCCAVRASLRRPISLSRFCRIRNRN